MFKHNDNWEWIWLLAAVGLVAVAGEIWRRRALRRFADGTPPGRLRRTSWMKGIILFAELLAMVLLVAALTDPRWGHRVERIPEPQVQLVFAVDVSRSMSAEDSPPSRLHCARTIIAKCLDELDGERVALIDFAGNARTAAPLTRNYADVKAKLDALQATGRLIGGSELRAAFQAGCDAFLHQMAGEKVLVVLTDGEDHGTTDVAQLASIAAECECHLLIVGLGDPVAGARIPVAQTASGPEYLKYKGETIVSRRNDELLETLASLTDGTYLPTNSADVDLAGAYRDRVVPTFKAAHRERPLRVGVARFPWFLASALGILVCAHSLQGWPGEDRSFAAGRRLGSKTSSPSHLLAAMAVLFVGLGASAHDLVRTANRHFRAGRLNEALAGYERAAVLNPQSALPGYNQAVAYYRSGDRAAARAKLNETLAIDDDLFAARAEFLLGNCDYADVIAGGLSKEQATARLQDAIGHYRQALAVQPEWDDPRVNIELAQMLIEEIQHAPESPQDSEEPGDGGKESGPQPTSSSSQQPDAGQDQTSQSSANKAAPPPGQQEDNAKGQASGQEPKGPPDGTPRNGGTDEENAKQKPPRTGNSGGSGNSSPSGGQGPNAQSGENQAPDRSTAQQRLDQILQQSRQREAEQKRDDGRQSAEVDKDW